MKVFLAVFRAMFGMGAVTFVWVLIVFVFATIGVQLFNGRFWYCADSAGLAVTSGYSATNSTIAIGNMVRACMWVSPLSPTNTTRLSKEPLPHSLWLTLVLTLP